MKRAATMFVLLATLHSTAALSADPRYPDWPCAQAKVPEISLAAVWEGPPLDEASKKWKDDPKVTALVARVAARRTPLDQAEKEIADFLSGLGDGKKQAGLMLFAGLFDTLNVERASVMKGLERITRKQRDAADKIRAETMKLHELQDTPQPDQTKINELANQLTWETRILEDRRRITKFVCEVPTAIDQRLFALARIIQQQIG
jgi:hypothetical protein